MIQSRFPATLFLALVTALPQTGEARAFDARDRPPFLDRGRILPIDGLDQGPHGGMLEPWQTFHTIFRGVLSNDCVIEFPETRPSESSPSGTHILLWCDSFNETEIPLTNQTVLARVFVDFDAFTVEPLPSPAPLSDPEALSIVTNRFPDAVGIEGVPPLIERIGGITIVGIPAQPDERTDGRHYLYDPIVWIHDETKVIFEFCSQESEIPVPTRNGESNRGQEGSPPEFSGWDDRSLTTQYDTHHETEVHEDR